MCYLFSFIIKNIEARGLILSTSMKYVNNEAVLLTDPLKISLLISYFPPTREYS